MSEANKVKVRVCKKCNKFFETTAKGIKAHAEDC